MILIILFILCFHANFLLAVPLSTPSPTDPRSTEIGTPCSNDTTQAWLDIVFVIDNSQFMTAQKMKSLSSGLTSIFTKFTIGQNGDHTTRVGIVTYASDVTVHHNLTSFSTTSQLLQAFYSLPSYSNMNDSEAHIVGALRAAYKLLPIENKTRVPLIVLIGANYDHNNFDGLEKVDKEIKMNGINIMTISFASAESPLTKTFQKISSYSYISTQKGLYDIISDALTQVNCVCPKYTQQFSVYNPLWLNYTKYADCIFGNIQETLPQFGNIACSPGTLVSLVSKDKQNFVMDRIVPDYLRGKKEFLIGLHKSSFDGGWDWWGYNRTEYPAAFQPMNTKPDDKYAYLMNYKGFNWEIKTTDGNEPFPVVCQIHACDANNFCDITPL